MMTTVVDTNMSLAGTVSLSRVYKNDLVSRSETNHCKTVTDSASQSPVSNYELVKKTYLFDPVLVAKKAEHVCA
jgi:hypothetical protein